MSDRSDAIRDHEVSAVAGTAPTMTPAANAMVSLIQTTIGTILGPLVGQLDGQRLTIERQAETIAELREDRGRLSAELASARMSISTLTGPGSTIAPGLTPP
jgi:hypothetical protein